MATYYHGAPEIQPDELQTLCLMNPGYVGYSADATSPSSNMVFLNSTPNSHHQAHVNGLSQAQHQHLVGIPLHQNPPVVPVHDMSPAGSHGLLQRGGEYNLWNPSPTNNSVDLTSHLGHHRASTAAQQGLSLSLSPQQKQNYAINQQSVISPAGGNGQVTFSGSSSAVAQSGGSNGISGLQRVLLGSKYLRAAQKLLDDVVSVGKGVKEESLKTAAKATTLAKGSQECEQTSGRETSGKRAATELSTAERQELQMKKAKLINMFDEVEQRYRQYHNQMQIVISSFEVIAGVGTARTYTALALQTISKQFRCLRDAISGQIRATSKNLGEEDCAGSKSNGLSRLRFVDHQLRQQRALQQLGTMQNNAWRPQRGLPERSVSVLRAWLFEHFLHPYPKDSDKHILAKQTGLTRNQVSNWFINARVRLWKPMVEEMYLEETKEQEQQHHQQQHLNHKADDRSSKSEGEAIPTTAVYGEEDEDMMRSKLKKPRTRESSLIDPMSTLEMDLKPIDTSTTTTTTSNSTDLFMRFSESSDFGAPYSIGEISRFGSGQQFTPQPPQYPGNGVSLTLGLQHCEGLSLSGPPPATYLSTNDSSSNNNIPLGRRLQGLSSSTHDAREYSNSEYESLSIIQNGKGFASQLMSDFVT